MNLDLMDAGPLRFHLKNALRDLDALKRDRDEEIRQHDDAVEFCGQAAYFIRTLDGHLCHKTRRDPQPRWPQHGEPAFVYFQEYEEAKGIEEPMTLVRRVRRYEQTDQRIRGVPVFQEVRLDA